VTEALIVRGLDKTFAKPAVMDLDLTVHAGELYALLGPNGAGKTTTLRMVAGLTRPDKGEIRVFGIDARTDPAGAKAVTAWAPDEAMIYDKLTPLEYLEFVAGLWNVEPKAGKSRADDLLAKLGLASEARRRCEGFSRGMKQKVALAGALIHDPKLLILDEPLTGLDAAAARLVKDMLQDRVRAGGAVILTTHILEVAERMADRIGIIAGGRLLAEGTLEALRAQTRRDGGAGPDGGSTLEDVFLQLTADPVAAAVVDGTSA
jgi:ABC-2 type transport system ATP-binding protein